MVLPDPGFDECRPEGSHQYGGEHGDYCEILKGQIVRRYGCRTQYLGNDQVVAVIVEDQSYLDDKKLNAQAHDVPEIAPVCKAIRGGTGFYRDL